MIPAGLLLVFSHTELSCKASYYTQFPTNIKIKIKKLMPVPYFEILMFLDLKSATKQEKTVNIPYRIFVT